MFYSNNDGYMQDLYFYNQVPNNTYMNSMGNNMVGNPNMQTMTPGIMNNMPNNQMFPNSGMFSGTTAVQNLNNLYPSIYKILNPVISRVVSNNNQFINDDLLNNMTDTVFNIVEGQIDLGDDQVQKNTQNENQTNMNSSNNSLSNNSSNRASETTRQTNQNIQNSNTRNNRNDSLLRDIIKILIIKEFLSRNQFQRQFSNNFSNNISNPIGYTAFSNGLNF